jgi:hypothetical protein
MGLLSDDFEFYLGMLYHQNPETCMATAKCLVELGLKYESPKKATIDLGLSSPSSSSARPASASTVTPLSPNSTPPSLSKIKRKIDRHHQTAKAFTKFVYIELLREIFINSYSIACQKIFNAFLHEFPARTSKVVYLTLRQITKRVKHAESDRGENNNLNRFLDGESPWIALAADIHSSSETSKFLTFPHLVIANIIRLHKNDVI